MLVPATTTAGGCRTERCRVLHHSAKHCSQAKPRPCIRRAAVQKRVSYPLMRAISWCESRNNPGAANPSGAKGLMQFMPGTWRSTPYGFRSAFSAKWNAIAGAWLLRRDGSRHWNASRHCWG